MKLISHLILIGLTLLLALPACTQVLSKGRSLGGGNGDAILGVGSVKIATLYDHNYLKSVRGEIFKLLDKPAGSPTEAVYYKRDGSVDFKVAVPLNEFLSFTVGAYKALAFKSRNEVFVAGEGTPNTQVIVEACFGTATAGNSNPITNLIVLEEYVPSSSAAPLYYMGFSLTLPTGEVVEIPFQLSSLFIEYGIRHHQTTFAGGETIYVNMSQTEGAPCVLTGDIVGPATYHYEQAPLLRKYRDL